MLPLCALHAAVKVGTNQARPRSELPQRSGDDSDGDDDAAVLEAHLQPLARLPYFNFKDMVVLDAMHTIGGVLQSLIKLILGLKETARVDQYELAINRRKFDGSHIASAYWLCRSFWSCAGAACIAITPSCFPRPFTATYCQTFVSCPTLAPSPMTTPLHRQGRPG